MLNVLRPPTVDEKHIRRHLPFLLIDFITLWCLVKNVLQAGKKQKKKHQEYCTTVYVHRWISFHENQKHNYLLLLFLLQQWEKNTVRKGKKMCFWMNTFNTILDMTLFQSRVIHLKINFLLAWRNVQNKTYSQFFIFVCQNHHSSASILDVVPMPRG